MRTQADMKPEGVAPEHSRHEQKTGALSVWRKSQWMWFALTRDQVNLALQTAEKMVAADEAAMLVELAWHNCDRRRLNLPTCSQQEFRQMLTQVVMHDELLKMAEPRSQEATNLAIVRGKICMSSPTSI